MLLLALHGDLLRTACAHSGRHFAGLVAAARFLHRDGLISVALKKRLTAVDAISALLRHVALLLAAKVRFDLASQFVEASGKSSSLAYNTDARHICGT